MKREGRQHGTVRTLCILPSSPLNPNGPVQRKATPTLGSPPTAGIFTRVPAKPTNHSKFTGKCGRARCSDCHLHPSGKSKDKIKGARTKLRSTSDPDLGFGGLLAWRVIGKSDYSAWPHYKVKLDSQSASDILYELYSDYDYYDDEYTSGYGFGYGSWMKKYVYSSRYRNHNRNRNRNRPINEAMKNPILNLDSLVEYPFISRPISRPIHRVSKKIDSKPDEDEGQDGDEAVAKEFGEIIVVEDDDMGFYDVAIVWETIDGDEGWSLVGEI